MKKASGKDKDEMREEYDLSKLKGRVRGKHRKAFRRGTNLVLLEPDIAKAFPDATSVNEALRVLAKVASRQSDSKRGPGKKSG